MRDLVEARLHVPFDYPGEAFLQHLLATKDRVVITCLNARTEATPARIARLRATGNARGAELLGVLHAAKEGTGVPELAAAGYGPSTAGRTETAWDAVHTFDWPSLR